MHVTLDKIWMRWLALIVGAAISLPWMGVENLWLQGSKLLVASALLTFAFMPVVIRLAKRMGAMDYPDERRVHQQPTPRIGGLAVFLAVNITLLLNFNYSVELKAICISGALVALVSLWDDARGLSASFKLLVQLIAVGILLNSGLVLEFGQHDWLLLHVGEPWGEILDEAVEYLLTALWIIGITNAFNFLDGINGLAAALAATMCLLMALLAAITGQVLMFLLCVAVAGAALGFLPDNARYNRPARAFLGDTGSTYLGWMMAGIAVMGDWSDNSVLQAYAAPLLIFSVPIFDMIYTTVARVLRGDVKNFREWIAYVGRDHLHHRLMYLGMSQARSVLAIITLALITGLAALVIVDLDLLHAWILLAQAVVIYGVFSFIMVWAARRVGQND
ncbi:MAG: MraY family glycosyltransferase [Mariprofundaceae bacterium]|nr:MraY family glycosyltransferase [Mariprofundaceae bacterium]